MTVFAVSMTAMETHSHEAGSCHNPEHKLWMEFVIYQAISKTITELGMIRLLLK